jgi:murein DD-endopeptidase
MLWMKKPARCLLAITLAALHAAMADPALGSPPQQSFDIQVPWVPIPVAKAGIVHVMYELHLTNFSSDDLLVREIQVEDPGSGTILGDFRGAELERMTGRVDRKPASTNVLMIPPGVRAVVYLDVPISHAPGNPVAFRHWVSYEQPSSGPRRSVVQGGAFTIRRESQTPLGPPLRGGPWAAIYESSWVRGHRRVEFAVQGSAHVPGRFAIDWIKVDRNGRYFRGNGSNVADWYGYAAEVLAVADGVVSSTRDGAAEPSTVARGVVPTPPGALAGNYVALDLGGGRYAFYEHLKPGSIRVKPGDVVTRGQTIGLLGYTGQSTGPHLHFHVADRNSPLDAEGLPYRLQAFTLLGAYATADAFAQSQPWQHLASGADAHRRGEFPTQFCVVDFDLK